MLLCEIFEEQRMLCWLDAYVRGLFVFEFTSGFNSIKCLIDLNIDKAKMSDVSFLLCSSPLSLYDQRETLKYTDDMALVDFLQKTNP